MEPAAHPTDHDKPAEPDGSPGRFSIHGDLPARALDWAAKHCPLYLEPIFLAGYSIVTWALLRSVRRAVAKNIGILLPGTGRFGNQLRALRVFWNFANTCVDTSRVRSGGDIIDWEIVGGDHFHQLADAPEGEGAIVLTAHMGSYDVAAPVFAHKFGRKVHAVRAPERDPRTQALRERDHARAEDGADNALSIAYNTGRNFLGVDLVEALTIGEVVAIQGDRVLFDVAPLTAMMAGARVQFPKGPFTLALASKAPIYPLFVIRTGRRSYQVRVEPPFHCERLREDGRDKEPAFSRATAAWAAALEPIARRHWYQWYVFEPYFSTEDV